MAIYNYFYKKNVDMSISVISLVRLMYALLAFFNFVY